MGASSSAPPLALLLAAAVVVFFSGAVQARAIVTRRYTFNVQMATVTRLCSTKSIVTVNGQFPGPKIVAREGDRLVVRVVNHVPYNVSIHWHGIRQLLSGWADGPAYITQCPIRPGQSYVHRFRVVGQRGTLWWHAHISWLRATVHGPIVVLPPPGVPHPFPNPYEEVPVVLGEWWRDDTEAVIDRALRTGGSPQVSDAFTINGLPGPLYNNCSAQDTFKLKVKPGKTYLLRLVNAALNEDLFFAVANHTLTIVGVDASYVKPVTVDTLVIMTGQTANVLLTALPAPPGADFYILARPYTTIQAGLDDTTTVAGIMEYDEDDPAPGTTSTSSLSTSKRLPILTPTLPQLNDTSFVAEFTGKLRSLATAEYPADVPLDVDRRFFFTVGFGTLPCSANGTCQGPNGSRLAASVNNISFVLPRTTALLQAHYYSGMSNGVYSTEFPVVPPTPFNYTGTPPNGTDALEGTKVVVLPFGTNVELVMQGTSILGSDSHPLHLHGFNSFVVGQGSGNFDPANDPAKFNLVDPVERNTVGVPDGGWVAIRFRADNPGVWFMHCHLEIHLSWGLEMAWLVLDGSLPDQKLPPPPADLPKC